MRIVKASCSSFLVGVLIAGCAPENSASRSAPPVPTAGPVSEPEAKPPGGGGPRKYMGITYDIPETWRELPNQTAVDSKFVVPTSKGELELTLTTMGGGIDSNIERWAGQVIRGPADEPTRETIDVSGITGTLIDVRGTYNSTVATNNSGPRDDWRLVGIGLPVPQRDFFIKAVGPREAMVEFYDELIEFAKSGRIEK